MSDAVVIEFNRIVRRFAGDLVRPEYQAQRYRNRALLAEMQRRNLYVRQDPARDWEHCHVALAVKRGTAGSGRTILDVGGGGSILCYELAMSGFDVTVLDVDPQIHDIVDANAEELGLERRLRALHHDGVSAWPVGDERIDAITCVSVFEGLMRRQRADFFAECRRVLRPNGELLLTFDFGAGARLVGDPPCTADDLLAHIVRPSGLSLDGPLPEAPTFDGDLPPPVRLSVPDVDGFDYATAAYTFGALRLVKDAAAVAPPVVSASIAAPHFAASDPQALCAELLSHLVATDALHGFPPAVIRFEAWDEFSIRAWYWLLRPGDASQTDRTDERADCVLSGTADALRRLLRQPSAFWSLYYCGAFAPRGDMSLALRLCDRFPAVG